MLVLAQVNVVLLLLFGEVLFLVLELVFGVEERARLVRVGAFLLDVDVGLGLLDLELLGDFQLVDGRLELFLLLEARLDVVEQTGAENTNVSDLNGLDLDAPALGDRVYFGLQLLPHGLAVGDDLVDGGVGDAAAHDRVAHDGHALVRVARRGVEQVLTE